MDQRCAKNCGTSKGSSHTWNNLQFYFRIFCAYFIHQACHAIHTCISTADHGNFFAFHSFFKSQYATVYLFFHRSGKIFFVRESALNKVNIYGIPDDGVAVFQRIHCNSGHLVTASRSDSYYIYLIQNVPPNSGLPVLWSHHFVRVFF